MKTKYRFLFVLTLMFTLVTSAWAEESWDCGNTKVTLSDDGVLTVAAVDGTDGKMADYESVDDVAWTNYCWQIKSVVISDGVTSIGNYAFPRLYNVQSVSIGKDVKSIGSYAFYEWWNSFNSLTLPSSLEFIANYALKSTNINMLYVKAVTPPVLESDDAINSPMIYVPEGSVNAYKTAEYWKNRSYNIDIDMSDNYVPFSFDFSGYATVSGTVWKGLQQSMNITLNDGLTIANRNNLAEDNTFTPAKDAKDFAFGFTLTLPDAANLSFEQEQITANLFISPVDVINKMTISAGTPDEKGMIANVKAGEEVKMATNQGYKFKSNQGTVYSNTTVSVTDLKVGDIVKGNVTLSLDDKRLALDAYRWAYSYGIGEWSAGFSGGSIYFAEDASFWDEYRPINEEGANGNAWIVTKVKEGDNWDAGVSLAGISHDLDIAYNEDWTEATFTMPEDDVTVKPNVARDLTVDVDLDVLIDQKPATLIPIAKNAEGKFEIVGNCQFAATDKLDNNKKLTNGELIYTLKKKEGDEYIALPDLAPGIWRLEATGNVDKPYVGTVYGVDIELIDKFDIALKAANANTIEAGKATLKVGDEQMAPTEGKVEGVKIGTKVTITAKDGYKFRKVEVKKGGLLSIVITGMTEATIYYVEGETWEQAIQNHPEENSAWKIDHGYITGNNVYVSAGGNLVSPNDTIDPNAGYIFQLS